MKTDHVNETGVLGLAESTFVQTEPNQSQASAALTAGSCPVPASTLTPAERHRIESLKRKQRSDSFLHRLDDEQLTKVLQWLDEEEDVGVVYHNIIAPAPEGLGLDVSITSVRRLRAHVTATHAKCRATEILDTINEMDSALDLSPSAQSERIQSAINQLLHQKAFELVRTAPGSPELFELLPVIERLSALDLKRQKIALEREKMLRHHQRASTPPFTRHHHVQLTVSPSATSAPTEPALSSHNSHISHSSHNSPQLEIIAPLPEVTL